MVSKIAQNSWKGTVF